MCKIYKFAIVLVSCVCVCGRYLQFGAMDLGVVVKTEVVSDGDGLSSVNESLLTSASQDPESCPMSSSPLVSAVVDSKVSPALSANIVDASSALSMGLLPTSFTSTVPKVGGESTAVPLKVVIAAANSVRPLVPKTSVAQITSGIGQVPTLLVAPAVVTSPSCVVASPERKTVTVLPRSPLSHHGGPLAVVNARPLAPAGQAVNFTTRSPGKVTVLSLPKTSSVPAQFVTVVPSTGSGTAVPTAGLNNKPASMPYKVLIRPPTAAVSI